MLIESFIDSVYIIDDQEKEVLQLINELNSRDICVKYYQPQFLLENIIQLKNRKIIFLDLYVDERKSNLIDQISLIRKIFQKCLGTEFGSYGIILWTKHNDEVHEFKKKISLDSREYNLPLFIIPLDKNKYLRQNKFLEIFQDIEQMLVANTAANFFINWYKMVRKAQDSAVIGILSLISDYNKQNENLKFILFRLAQNYTGLPLDAVGQYPLHFDAFKALNDLLLNYANNQKIEFENIFSSTDQIAFTSILLDDNAYKKDINGKFYINDAVDSKEGKYKSKFEKLEDEILNVYAGLNSNLLLDQTNLVDDVILPGNIYEILGNSIFKIEAIENNHALTPILIELTPPCDFSNKKMKNPRCIGGFIGRYSRSQKDLFKKEHFYSEVFPIKFKEAVESNLMVFDFRYFGSIQESELKNKSTYKLLFRAKDKLFADILQKFSSHMARLGLSIIHP